MSTNTNKPEVLKSKDYQYDSFQNEKVLLNKKKKHLPAMGWNSWNAFGSGNTESLTKEMADAFISLGLDQLGYEYLVLDDGCYKQERVDGLLSNEEVKFPSGFRALADYIHSKGLKFGMYNDIGTNLCAGAAVGTCGHEMADAQSYVDWDIDFIKVDNCYYLWDNATFSDATNAKYVYAPNIKAVRVCGKSFVKELSALEDGVLTGQGAEIKDGYVTNIGTFDGTGPDATPIGDRSGELQFEVEVPVDGVYDFTVTYATGEEPGVGSWLQIAVGAGEDSELFYDDFVEATESTTTFIESNSMPIKLRAGKNLIRIMNHRRQENTLNSYAELLEGLNQANPEHDIIFSICEWGKTQPHNWGYKVGDSWRILNDITFQVGSDGNPGNAAWINDYTCSVTSQYNKAVIMDEFAGLSKGWNDPDMLTIGMNGMTDVMNQTHMTMWCMMNSPLMLGLDLRRVKKGDELYKVIANQDLIALNQDALGIQAKRISCLLGNDKASIENPDITYVRDNNRVDILAKPLSDGSLAISFINVSDECKKNVEITLDTVVKAIGTKMVNAEQFPSAKEFEVVNLWTKEVVRTSDKTLQVSELEAYGNATFKVKMI